jgi:hypothetical protein
MMTSTEKNKILLLILIGIMSFHASLYGQVQRAKGLVYNAEKYSKLVKTRDLDTRGNTMRTLPIRLSLRPFCPTPQDQGAEPSCTAWAIAYGALTIQNAIQRKVNNPKDIDKIASSKSFVYNQLTDNKQEHVPSIEATFDFLSTRGTCLAATFRNDVSIHEKPDELAMYEAQTRRLVKVIEVYNPDSTITVKRQIQRFKRLLADSIPIVVGLRLPFSFSNLTEKVFSYSPDDPLDASAHALCLIGYDDIDSTFECMNSWGTAWGGDQGFVRLRYEDLFVLICCAYRITPQFLVEKKSLQPKGSIVLRRSVGYNASRIPQFEEIRVRYDSTYKYYQSTQPVWEVGSSFQFALREVPNDWWVYIFAINKNGATTLFHSDQVNSRTVEKVVPDEETKIELEEEGTDWMGILYSKQPIADFQLPMQNYMQKNTANIPKQIALYFKDIVADPVVYSTHRMGFALPKTNTTNAALMLLKIDTH